MTYNFKQARFYTTVNDLQSLPVSKSEIAIVGRSNAGKSSMLNTLTNQNRLAYTSKKPGRTQHINYFEVSSGIYLVDLPGYGYAKVPEHIRTHWVSLLGDYLQFRQEIMGLVLIMDARHPLRDLDVQMVDFFATTGKPLHIVLSKADKLSNQEKIATLKKTQAAIAASGFINLSVQMFSALHKTGVSELEVKLNEWLV